MRKFRSLRVEGIPFFKDQTFTFDRPGIHVIHGLNLGNRKRSTKTIVPKDASKAHSNAVGKSLFFSCIRELFFKEGVTGKAKDKFKQGKITLAIDEGSKKYSLCRYLKGTSEKFIIERDGKEITPERSDDQHRMMQKILGLEQETFEIIYHLDARVPHPLRTGDTAKRKEFFTKFFNLASADALRKLVRAEKDSLRQEAAVLAELQSQEKELKTLTKEEINVLEKLVSSYDSKIDKAQQELEALREVRELARFCSENRRALAALKRSGQILPSEYLESLAVTKAKLNKELRSFRAVNAYTEELRVWKKAKVARSDFIEANSLSVDRKKVLQELQDANVAKIEFHKDNISKAKVEKASLEVRLETYQSKLDDCTSDLKTLRKSGECSKCGQPVTNKHYAVEKERLTESFAVSERKVKELTKEIQKLRESIELYEVELAKQGKLQVKVNKGLAIYDEIPKLPEKPEKPNAYDLPEDWDEEVTREEISKIDSRIELVEEINQDLLAPKIKLYLAGEVPELNDEAYDALVEKLVDLRQKVTEKNVELSIAKEHIQARITMRKRMKEIETRVQELEDLEILDQAFSSNNGVKQLQINSICSYLEAKVNEYSKFFFSEDYSFKFDLGTQFTITATRSPEGQKIVSDVRKLSGAEGGFFDLMLAISLMTFLPPAKRCNLMILDELDAGFGPDMTDKFVKFLPKLATVIEHIVIITPRVQVSYGESVHYHTVVKQGAHSRILPGRATEVQL